ncbi:hypothetical protein [Salinarimonas soli]|uniref:Uncharacterized protein n=1 Tax=Salinarimonas soli TaxID=1638099 RepID=A0A5B2V801_9HYPH|nr:hypothetical protein [Salinarimonas soli]KAA2235164.1 hypothetical protein F0L46_20680 [Salinarimonas soli]
MKRLPSLAVLLLAPGLALAQAPDPAATSPGPAPAQLAPAQPRQAAVTLRASFAGNQQPIRAGMIWRVYEDRGEGIVPNLVVKSDLPNPTLPLPPGNYIVHAAYGFASASTRLAVQWTNLDERVTISAGALRLKGAVGESPIAPGSLSFSIYVPIGNDAEGRLVVGGVRGDEVVRLPEGTYHVVSNYGDTNAIMRSDLRVEAGRVTEATLNHRAATVTLKLVASEGGEAFAGTAFSVLTPGGDVIREAIGAFPSLTLAEGEYVLIARHEGQVHTREFKVESGLNRDIEVLAKK